MFSNDEIRQLVTKAFQPLRCVAEIFDYDQKLRFKVFDAKDAGVLRVDSLVLRELRERTNLRSVLQQARVAVEDKGFHLEPLKI